MIQLIDNSYLTIQVTPLKFPSDLVSLGFLGSMYLFNVDQFSWILNSNLVALCLRSLI